MLLLRLFDFLVFFLNILFALLILQFLPLIYFLSKICFKNRSLVLKISIIHKGQRFIFFIDCQEDAVWFDINTLYALDNILVRQICCIDVQLGFMFPFNVVQVLFRQFFATKGKDIVIGEVRKSLVNCRFEGLIG